LTTNDIVQAYIKQYKIKDLLEVLPKDNFAEISGVTGSSLSFWICAAFHSSSKSFVYIAENIDEAEFLYHDLQSLGLTDVILLQDSFKRLTRGIELSKKNIALRLQAVNKIIQNKRQSLVITYPEALAERLIDFDNFKEKRIEISVHKKYKLQALIDICEKIGLSRSNFVYEPGQYSLRGSIVDIFSFGFPFPYRIELNDDEVESIRQFDVETQTSIHSVSFIHITPNVTQHSEKGTLTETSILFDENFIVLFKNKNLLFDQYLNAAEQWQNYRNQQMENIASSEFQDILQHELCANSTTNLQEIFHLPQIKIA